MRTLPAKYKTEPPVLEKVGKEKRLEAVIKLRNVGKFGILRRNYLGLQHWASSCR